MNRRAILWVSLGAAGMIFVGVAIYLHRGASWEATTKEQVALYRTEFDAAYNGSSTLKTAPAIETIDQGASVAVLWDTYGKDYWACYVRVSDGKRGWLLCTDLQSSSASGT